MDIKIWRSMDGWITISSCGKSMNVRLTRDEFYAKDMHIKVLSSEPNELNQYKDVEIGNATISFDDKYKTTRKEIQKKRRRNQRLQQIRQEALANLTNYLMKNENISYQVIYQETNEREKQWWDYKKYTDDRINTTIQKSLEKHFNNVDDGNSIDLNPRKRKDKIFINKDIIKQNIKNIENILLSDGATFKNNTGRVLYDEEKAKTIDSKILEEVNKNGEYIAIEQGKYRTNEFWFH